MREIVGNRIDSHSRSSIVHAETIEIFKTRVHYGNVSQGFRVKTNPSDTFGLIHRNDGVGGVLAFTIKSIEQHIVSVFGQMKEPHASIAARRAAHLYQEGA